MNKSTKVWLIAATSLIATGLIMFAAVMTLYHWDLTKLDTNDYNNVVYTVDGEFCNIDINVETADIDFAVSIDGTCSAVCRENNKAEFSADISDGTLVVGMTESKKWYDYLGINFDTMHLTVYLPKTEYEKLCIKCSTGNIEIPSDFVFGEAEISTSTGDITVKSSVHGHALIKTNTGNINVNDLSVGAADITATTGDITVLRLNCDGELKVGVTTGETLLHEVKCESLASNGSTGDIEIVGVVADDKMCVERTTGDVSLDRSDAAYLFIKTSTGDVTGNILSEKVFFAESSSGNIKVPRTVNGGRCEIITSTGDIEIDIADR